MKNPIETYIRDVLGIQSVVVPEELMQDMQTTRPPHFQVSGDFNSALALVSFQPVSLSERELCQKMLMASGYGPFLLIEFSSKDDEAAIKEFIAAYRGRGVWLFGDGPKDINKLLGNKSALQLPALSELTDHSNPQALMEKKKQAWQAIKNFQAEFTS